MSEQPLLAPIERSRISKQITIQLCRMIGQGQLQPGDRLPPERELAELLQVSRASLREALRVLEMAGVITIRQGGGTFVRALADDGLLSPLLLMLDVRGDLVGDLLEVRIMFEPETTARAALRATADNLAELERNVAAQGRLVEAGERSDDWLALDRQFHVAIARASQNEVAVRVTRFITDMLQDVQRHFVASDQRMRHAFARQQQILLAVSEREPRRARDTMLQHLREVERFVLREVTAEGRGQEPPASSRTGGEERGRAATQPTQR